MRVNVNSIRVLLLAAVLAGWAAAGGALARPASLSSMPDVPWWVLAALFAITEAFVLQLGVRGKGEAVSLSEVPLVIGLFLAQPHEVLISRVIGGAAVFVLYHRHTLLKAAFNTALTAAGASTALFVFGLILGNDGSLDIRAWTASIVAVAAAGLLDGTMLFLVVSWYDGRRPWGLVIREILFAVLVPALVAVGGIVSVLALTRGAAAIPLAVTGAAGLIGYRAFATLADRHASLERLYVLSDALAAAPAASDVIASVLSQSHSLLRTDYSELVLAGYQRGRTLRWHLRSGGETEGPVNADETLNLPFPPTEPVVINGDTRAERTFLSNRGIDEALMVPLRVDESVAGHLLVADRNGEERGFTTADARLLETVANHGSIALRNGRLIDRLHFEARHDELTGLPNRLYFRDLLEEAGTNVKHHDKPCSVMVLDFDGFKAINDTLGHQAGDELLRVLSRRFAENAGKDALVARLGGDEFAVLSTVCAGEDAAMALAQRLLAAFDQPVEIAGTRLRLGGSLGISLGPRDGVTGTDLLRHADIAMYAAKAGAGGARLFTKDLVEVTASSLTLASDLRDAVGGDEISVVLQPLVRLDDGAVHSLEVLARWSHPELGEIPPEAFFAAAERSGQITTLSARVLDQALGECRRWHEQGLSVRVAVNLAPRWLADSSLPEQIGLALARRQVPADLLCLEITESGVIADPRRAVETLSRLREMGVHLSVDDFGTGYSSLTYLSQLPVHQMKIDKSFVQRLHVSPRDRALAQSIIDLGRNLGLEVVAEGVMDVETHVALREMGCLLGQGYLFMPPFLPDEFPDVAARRGIVGGRSADPEAEQLPEALAAEAFARAPAPRRPVEPAPAGPVGWPPSPREAAEGGIGDLPVGGQGVMPGGGRSRRRGRGAGPRDGYPVDRVRTDN